MPNRANFLWIEADKPGYFWGQCAEFCGESHAVMRFRVIALGPQGVQRLGERPDGRPPARSPVPAAGDRQRRSSPPTRPSRENEARLHGPAFDGLSPLEAWRKQQLPDAATRTRR